MGQTCAYGAHATPLRHRSSGGWGAQQYAMTTKDKCIKAPKAKASNVLIRIPTVKQHSSNNSKRANPHKSSENGRGEQLVPGRT